MIEERRPVDLIAPDGSITPGEFLIRDEATGNPDQVEVVLILPDQAFQAVADDCFEALILIRLELEAVGLLLRCWGASLNVYPSVMSRSMRIGDTAYKLALGCFARSADRVNIFESGPGLVAATIAEQEDFSRAWFDSLANPPHPRKLAP